MFSKSKSEENDECDIFKDSSTSNGHLNNNTRLMSQVSPQLSIRDKGSDYNESNLRSYLDTIDDDYEVKPIGVHLGRTTRSMSVTGLNNGSSRKLSDITEFHKYFGAQNSKDQAAFDAINLEKQTSECLEKEINFHEIDCNFKSDKNELKVNEIKEVDLERDCRIGTKYKTSLDSDYSPFTSHGSLFSPQQSEFTSDKIAGSGLIKTPPLLKTSYDESRPLRSPIYSTDTHFHDSFRLKNIDYSPTENLISGPKNYNEFNLYKSFDKSYTQTNSLFELRKPGCFPYGSGLKKRSFSEADLTKTTAFDSKSNARFINDDYYTTLYRTNKLTRSVSESCIDPRTFYKNECHNHIMHVNKENLAKPTHSYAQIITQAISNSADGKLSLGEIYKWIEDNFEYYKYANPVWKNSIRHNLSLSKCFKKVPREHGSKGKGGKWMLDKEFIYLEEAKKKRKSYGEENIQFGNVLEEDNGKIILQNGYLTTSMQPTDSSCTRSLSRFENCK